MSPGLDSEPFIGARGARGPRPGLTLGRFLVHLPVHLPPRRTRTARVRKREKARDGAASYFSIKTKIAQNRCFDPPSILCVCLKPTPVPTGRPPGPGPRFLISSPPFFLVSLPNPNFKVARKGAPKTRRPPEQRTSTHTHCRTRAAFVLAAPPARCAERRGGEGRRPADPGPAHSPGRPGRVLTRGSEPRAPTQDTGPDPDSAFKIPDPDPGPGTRTADPDPDPRPPTRTPTWDPKR